MDKEQTWNVLVKGNMTGVEIALLVLISELQQRVFELEMEMRKCKT